MQQRLDHWLDAVRPHLERLRGFRLPAFGRARREEAPVTNAASEDEQRIRPLRFGPSRATKRSAPEPSLVAWSELLIWFFRIMALFQLAKGLVHWDLLVMDSSNTIGLIPSTAVEEQSVNIYFAVIDVVAGVGLWMTSSWGAVLWLLAAVSQIAVCVGFPEIYGSLWPLVIFEVLGISVYVFLTWKVAQTNEDA